MQTFLLRYTIRIVNEASARIANMISESYVRKDEQPAANEQIQLGPLAMASATVATAFSASGIGLHGGPSRM